MAMDNIIFNFISIIVGHNNVLTMIAKGYFLFFIEFMIVVITTIW